MAAASADGVVLLKSQIQNPKSKIQNGKTCAARIVKGKLVTIPINQQLYIAITRKADADAVNKTINCFLAGGTE